MQMMQTSSDKHAAIASAQVLASSAPVNGLPMPICAWLYAAHEQLARELHRAQSAPADIDSEPTIAVDALPEPTRRYLWQGMQRYHPALAELVRDPMIAQTRTHFAASLHLYVPDILKVIVGASRANPRSTKAVASQTPPSVRTHRSAARRDEREAGHAQSANPHTAGR